MTLIKAWADGQLDRDLFELRNKRNRLLTETDWWGAYDNTMTADQTKYRKDSITLCSEAKIRNLPNTSGNPQSKEEKNYVIRNKNLNDKKNYVLMNNTGYNFKRI